MFYLGVKCFARYSSGTPSKRPVARSVQSDRLYGDGACLQIALQLAHFCDFFVTEKPFVVSVAKTCRRVPGVSARKIWRIGRILRRTVMRGRMKAECAQSGGRGTFAQLENGKMLLVILIRVNPPIFAPIPPGYHINVSIDGNRSFQ